MTRLGKYVVTPKVEHKVSSGEDSGNSSRTESASSAQIVARKHSKGGENIITVSGVSAP